MDRITVWLARVGFLSIAACTFGLSFDAIRDVAQSTGAVDPALAWIVPLAVDGMIVTATAVLWTESLTGRGWHMFPLAAIVGPAALSMWANIAHASGQSLLAQVLAAVPPAGLILSLELVAWQIRRERQPDGGRRARFSRGSVAGRTAAADAGALLPSQGTPAALPASGGGTAAPRTNGAHAADAGDTGSNGSTSGGAASSGASNGTASSASNGDGAGRNDDTDRIALDVSGKTRGSRELWHRITEVVHRTGTVPTQRELAEELKVPRSRVQRAITRHREEWERLRAEIERQAERTPETASVGAGHDGG